MAKSKISFDKAKAQEFLIQHVEKIAFGVFGLLFAGLCYFALTRERFTETTPEGLTQLAKSTEQFVQNNAYRDGTVKLGIDFRGKPTPIPDVVNAAGGAIDGTPYRVDQPAFNPPPVAIKVRRKQPQLLPAIDLETHAGYGPILMYSPMTQGAGGSPYGGAGGGAPGMGPGIGPGVGPGVGPGAGAGGAGLSPGLGMGGGRGGEGEEGEGPYGGGMGGMMGMGGFGGPEAPMIQAPPGAKVEGRRWVCLTGLVPIMDQMKNYTQVFQDANYVNPATDYPRYFGYEIERADVTGLGATLDPAQLTFEKLDVDAALLETLTGYGKGPTWGAAYPEVIDPNYGDVAVTMPIPPVTGKNHVKESVGHAKVPFATLNTGLGGYGGYGAGGEGEEGQGPYGGGYGQPGAPGTGGGEGEGEEGRPAMPPGGQIPPGMNPLLFRGGAGGGMGGMGGPYGGGMGGMGGPYGGGMGAPGMGAPGMGAPGMGAPGMGAPGMGAPGMGAPGMGAPGMGGPYGGGMGGGMGMGGYAQRRIDHRMLRFFDFNVQPGRSYVYRVKLKLFNPNKNVLPQYLESPDLAKEDSITGPASELSARIDVPYDTHVMLGEVANLPEPKAKVQIRSWDQGNALNAVSTFENVLRGYVADFSKKVWVQPVAALAEEKDMKFFTASTVLDIHGRERIPESFGKRPIYSPAEMLVMGPDGELMLKTQLSEAITFLDEAKKQAALEEAQTMPAGGLGPGGLGPYGGGGEGEEGDGPYGGRGGRPGRGGAGGGGGNPYGGRGARGGGDF